MKNGNFTPPVSATSLGDILDRELAERVIQFLLRDRRTGQITLNAKDGRVRSIDVREVISVSS